MRLHIRLDELTPGGAIKAAFRRDKFLKRVLRKMRAAASARIRTAKFGPKPKADSLKITKPWEAMDICRSLYFKRKREGKL
jgi:hypothetical protein